MNSGAQPAGAGRGKCPICGRPSERKYAPFCSRRCADVDLARWLRGAYVIPDRAESEDKGPDPAGATSKGKSEEG
ncbi:MAG TPA: DNA gyrase inhibitor YacG [Hyphomicrobiaceae bacterium]|nr:DNA gyrase inhibitor YacG [Hyphomicrobiaceae bacterium]